MPADVTPYTVLFSPSFMYCFGVKNASMGRQEKNRRHVEGIETLSCSSVSLHNTQVYIILRVELYVSRNTPSASNKFQISAF